MWTSSIYQSSTCCTEKKRRRKRVGQYNSNNKFIHGQYTSRYSLHHTHKHTPHSKSNDIIFRKRWHNLFPPCFAAASKWDSHSTEPIHPHALQQPANGTLTLHNSFPSCFAAACKCYQLSLLCKHCGKGSKVYSRNAPHGWKSPTRVHAVLAGACRFRDLESGHTRPLKEIGEWGCGAPRKCYKDQRKRQLAQAEISHRS